MAEQRKGTPILMKFFSDAFNAHLRTVSVNYTLHQYKLSVSPSGESDNELLETAIRAIGNAKPAVQNSLMSTQQIMREPNLPKQMVEDFDLHAQWCQSTLEDLDLCDATIRNAILSKDDYLAILSGALSPYYEAMGIPEDYPYPGDSEDDPDDIPQYDSEDDDDSPDDDDGEPVEPIIIADAPEPDVEGEIDPLEQEVIELRRQVAELTAQRDRVDGSGDDDDSGCGFEGPYQVDSHERTIRGFMGTVDGFVEDIVQGETVAEPVRPVVRPMHNGMRMSALKPRNRSSAPDNTIPTPEPNTDVPAATRNPIDSPEAPNTDDRPSIPGEEHTPYPDDEELFIQQVDPYHQPVSPETDYGGLFGYDQYDEPDNPQPLAEDPVRLSQIAEKASEVIIAARKKGGRAATKSSGTSAKGKGRTTSKTGQRKTASKSTGRTTKPRKKASEPSVTTDTEPQSVEQTPSENPSETPSKNNENQQEDTQ